MISEAGVKTISAYRRTAHATVPQIIVVIDGYMSFRNAYPDENESLETILREGGSLGITFVLTANRVTDIFEKFRSNIQNAVSFELSDPSDYYYAVGRPSKAPSQSASWPRSSEGTSPTADVPGRFCHLQERTRVNDLPLYAGQLRRFVKAGRVRKRHKLRHYRKKSSLKICLFVQVPSAM